MVIEGAQRSSGQRQGGLKACPSHAILPLLPPPHLSFSIRNTPILALTANALRGEAARAHDAGMDEYLTKPIRLTTLRAALERWLPGATPAMRSEAADAQKLPASLLDPAALSALVGDDHQLIREILADYRNALGTLTGQLLDAFGNGDLTGVGALAHRLKSSSRAVGATRLGQLCAVLEQAATMTRWSAASPNSPRSGPPPEQGSNSYWKLYEPW